MEKAFRTIKHIDEYLRGEYENHAYYHDYDEPDLNLMTGFADNADYIPEMAVYEGDKPFNDYDPLRRW